MPMSVLEAVAYALAAIKTLRGLGEAVPGAATGPELMKLKEADEVLSGFVSKVQAHAVTQFGVTAERAGFPKEVAERLVGLMTSNNIGNKEMEEHVRDYEARMVAAGLDPDDCKARIEKAVKAGDPQGAQAVFAEIRNTLKAHEAKASE